MRVLFLVPDLVSIGGIQRYCRLAVASLDRCLSERGGCLSVFSLNDTPPPRLAEELRALRSTELVYFSGRRVAFLRRFTSAVRGSTAIIYGLLGFAPMTFLATLSGRRRPSALLLYGLEAWQYRGYLYARAVRRIDNFISISRYTLEAFRGAYGLCPGPGDMVIPNAVSPELVNAQVIADSQPCASPRLLSVSRLAAGHDEPKGIDLVIRSLPSLLRQFPDLVYVVVGDGGDRVRLEGLAASLGVQHAVRFLGFVSNERLEREFSGCSLFVMPSTKEGFGFVFIEAMAYGKPVVAARATAVPEVVDHGETGLLIEPGNVQQLGESISLLLRDSVLRDRMGRAARQAVERRFTYQKFQEKWLSVCDSLIRPPRA